MSRGYKEMELLSCFDTVSRESAMQDILLLQSPEALLLASERFGQNYVDCQQASHGL